jgi:cytochrome c biogenesis protein CcmG/thiol:disulfide interchange protein DsbE
MKRPLVRLLARVLARVLVLVALLAVVGPPLTASTRQAAATNEKPLLPPEWRTKAEPALRKFWDGLEGKPAPALAGLSGWLQTEARSWKDLRGKVVVLDMWATWCGPCVRGIPHLTEMYERYSEQGLVILGVHVQRGHDKMASWLAERDLPYAFVKDQGSRFSKSLKIKSIPSYFVVDGDGDMRVAGADRNKLEAIVEALLREKSGAAPSAPDATPAAPTSWPPIVEKQLHADQDMRGKQAPAFEVGEWITKQPKLAGKVLLIDFWATWCGPCRKSIPKLNKWHEKYKDKLAIIGLSSESRAVVTSFMKRTPMNYPQAIDEQATLNRKLGVKGIPHVLIVSTDGVVRWQGFPDDKTDPLTEETLRAIIALDPGK